MQLNVSNSLNFKNRYQDYDYEYATDYCNKAIEVASEVQDKFVPASDIKKLGPLTTAIVALISKLGFKGAATALLIDQTTKNKASNTLDTYLKQGLNKAQEIGLNMVEKQPKGLFKRVKNTIGEGLQNYSEQFGKVVAKNGPIKNFGIAGAVASILAFAPKALMADNNRDGINDIAQYSQVYDDSAAELDRLQEKANLIGRAIALLT